MAYANAYAPLSRRNEEEAEDLFKQQIETPDAPTVAPEEKGFLSKVAPMLVGAVANSFLPGSGAIASGVTSAALGGDGAQLNSPEAAKSTEKFTTWYGDKMAKDNKWLIFQWKKLLEMNITKGLVVMLVLKELQL